MKKKGLRYCYGCEDPVPKAKRCPFCKSLAFYRYTSPRAQSLTFMAELYRPKERAPEEPPDDL